MSAPVTNQSPYLRTTRDFPVDSQALSAELNKAYVDIANVANNRTIGIFPKNSPAINGESWFITGQRQQGLRQVYTFTSSTLTIPHGIKTTQIAAFTRIYGTFTDGTSWYPLPFVSATAANNQVQVVVNATNIVIILGAGAPPALVSGIVVLEWISQV